MWIAEFAQRGGVKPTTVRHYVREGLLAPKAGLAGGSRPYLEFTEADLGLLAAIRAGQALGLSLEEIRSLVAQRRSGNGKAKLLRAMLQQREKLQRSAIQLESMLSFLDRKIAWLEAGANGRPPQHAGEPGAAAGPQNRRRSKSPPPRPKAQSA
jgi:MerR family Zn(II)-responsive transcriptional regulator of zntA